MYVLFHAWKIIVALLKTGNYLNTKLYYFICREQIFKSSLKNNLVSLLQKVNQTQKIIITFSQNNMIGYAFLVDLNCISIK